MYFNSLILYLNIFRIIINLLFTKTRSIAMGFEFDVLSNEH
jgi:hypothetical protein